MAKKIDYQGIIEYIDKAQTIAIVSHANPDGDTMGGSLALYRALQMYGKKPYIFCDGRIPEKLKYLPLWQEYNKAGLAKYDISIAIDTSNEDMLGDIEQYRRGKIRLQIDHHISNTRYADENLVNVCSANAENVYRLIKLMGCIDDTVAKLLYCGLVTDSGGFSFSSVTRETLTIAADLIGYDIKAYEIFDKLMRKNPIEIFNLRNRVLSAAKFYDGGEIGIVTFRKTDFESTGTDSQQTEGIINNILNVEGVRVAVAISEIADKQFKVSFRSGEDVNSSTIAEVFGGGGHKNAAGCRLHGYYENVVDKILKAVRDEIC